MHGTVGNKSLPCANTGAQMGGWFTREVTSPEQYKGLRYRMAGPGAEVLRRMGATVVTLDVVNRHAQLPHQRAFLLPREAPDPGAP